MATAMSKSHHRRLVTANDDAEHLPQILVSREEIRVGKGLALHLAGGGWCWVLISPCLPVELSSSGLRNTRLAIAATASD
jgi:hypothetical protein